MTYKRPTRETRCESLLLRISNREKIEARNKAEELKLSISEFVRTLIQNHK